MGRLHRQQGFTYAFRGYGNRFFLLGEESLHVSLHQKRKETNQKVTLRFFLASVKAGKQIAKKRYGFLIYPEDGVIFSETELGKQKFMEHKQKMHRTTIPEEHIWGHRRLLHTHFVSDWLSFGPFLNHQEALYWMESFRMGMEFVLESGKDSWDEFIRVNGAMYEPVLFETVPWGTGMLELAFDAFEDINGRALEQLETYSCSNSCYRCLRIYWNQGFHARLGRKTAIGILNGIRDSRQGEVIEVPPTPHFEEPAQVR